MNATEASASAYDALGGEPMVRAVCARLYELMDILPEAKACRDVHPPSLQRAEERLYEFLTGWLGGPQLYREKYGHPRLRQRHLVAPIGAEEIAGWLACFQRAWDENVPVSPLADTLAERIDVLGRHMENLQQRGLARSGCPFSKTRLEWSKASDLKGCSDSAEAHLMRRTPSPQSE